MTQRKYSTTSEANELFKFLESRGVLNHVGDKKVETTIKNLFRTYLDRAFDEGSVAHYLKG